MTNKIDLDKNGNVSSFKPSVSDKVFASRGLSLRSKLVVEFGAVIVGIMALVIAVSLFGVPFTEYTGSLGYENAESFESNTVYILSLLIFPITHQRE